MLKTYAAARAIGYLPLVPAPDAGGRTRDPSPPNRPSTDRGRGERRRAGRPGAGCRKSREPCGSRLMLTLGDLPGFCARGGI